MKRCGRCKATSYCSKDCQKIHSQYHAVYCSSIKELEKLEKSKLYGDKSVRQSQLDSRREAKMIKLVGERPMVKCNLDGKDFEVLWDTGSMVSLVSRSWVQDNFPEKKMYTVEKFMGDECFARITLRRKSYNTFYNIIYAIY